MMEKLMLEGFPEFTGHHCETSALKTALGYHGLDISEEMLFGLGGGLGFIYWYMKMMPAPFVGGRNGKTTEFSLNVCRRLGVNATVSETASAQKGYQNLVETLRAGEPAVTFGDMVYLPYFGMPEAAHFGGHVFVVYGLDEVTSEAFIYDRPPSPLKVSLGDLARARGSKFNPFPPKHRLLRLGRPPKNNDLAAGISVAIRESCEAMANPPIKNFGLAGIEKWAGLIGKWPQDFSGLNLLGALMNVFIYIEIGGTGGSAFRPVYARFLEEASDITGKPALREAAAAFRESAAIWSRIAAGILPDDWPSLKRMRELMWQKNAVFEAMAPGALTEMQRLNELNDDAMTDAVKDIAQPLTFLGDVRQNILKLRDAEKEAFTMLNAAL